MSYGRDIDITSLSAKEFNLQEFWRQLKTQRWFLERKADEANLEFCEVKQFSSFLLIRLRAKTGAEYLVPVDSSRINFLNREFLNWILAEALDTNPDLAKLFADSDLHSVDHPGEDSTNPVFFLNRTICLKFEPHISHEANRELMLLQELAGTKETLTLCGSLNMPGAHCFALFTEVIPDSESGWNGFCRLLETGEVMNLIHQTKQLASAIYRFHEALRAVFPTQSEDEARKICYYDSLSASLQHLGQFNEKLLPQIPIRYLPILQIIHGDLHLGQILTDTKDTGRFLKVLDFEGAPLEPLKSRNKLRSPLHDVAGILRSLDYALILHYNAEKGEIPLEELRILLESAFMSTYFGSELLPERSTLVKMYCLQRSLYEVEYEKASRPDWVHIPQQGVDRLTEEILHLHS